MMGILTEVLNGWRALTENNKMPVLLLAALLYLCLRKNKKTGDTFVKYVLFMTILVLFPLTAAVLMTYQTRFYDYQWIWSFVPQTAAVAFGAVVFAGEDLAALYDRKKRNAIAVGVGLVLLAVVTCGLNYQSLDAYLFAGSGYDCETVLQEIKQATEGEALVWAPEKMTEYIGQHDSSVKLLYGRNMWDLKLNAYFFDTYPEELTKLHSWMDGEEGEESDLSAQDCVNLAEQYKVNCIVLPGDLPAEDMIVFKKTYRLVTVGDGYYIFVK